VRCGLFFFFLFSFLFIISVNKTTPDISQTSVAEEELVTGHFSMCGGARRG
jgi:hypothetical protein